MIKTYEGPSIQFLKFLSLRYFLYLNLTHSDLLNDEIDSIPTTVLQQGGFLLLVQFVIVIFII